MKRSMFIALVILIAAFVTAPAFAAKPPSIEILTCDGGATIKVNTNVGVKIANWTDGAKYDVLIVDTVNTMTKLKEVLGATMMNGVIFCTGYTPTGLAGHTLRMQVKNTATQAAVLKNFSVSQ
ncbi:MAG: hypothetical protein JW943_09320 [Deltaproteobacteria bacterium]|nr:hypothetical protein [Deltaproteobacteria bacterium]